MGLHGHVLHPLLVGAHAAGDPTTGTQKTVVVALASPQSAPARVKRYPWHQDKVQPPELHRRATHGGHPRTVRPFHQVPSKVLHLMEAIGPRGGVPSRDGHVRATLQRPSIKGATSISRGIAA